MAPRRVVVTAAASGIGLAVAEAFAADGARVFICDIDDEALRAVTASRPAIAGTVCDVSDRTAVEQFVGNAAKALRGIDVLVNNAGIAGPTTPVQEIDPDDWEAVLAVNLTGAFHVTRLAIPYLKQSEAGVIIIMSSMAGRFGYPNRSPYAVTKWGLVGFTKTLSRELGGDGIRVNAILPGAVAGERLTRVLQERARITGASLEEVTAAMLANQSLKRFVDPREIGALAVFLASPSARSISGQMISIDGDTQST
jgi:NAD(P)-dependent dehydrogenase (short-subunit alcohol dehydrogenase family)